MLNKLKSIKIMSGLNGFKLVVYKYELVLINFENYISSRAEPFFFSTKVGPNFNYISYILMIYRARSSLDSPKFFKIIVIFHFFFKFS